MMKKGFIWYLFEREFLFLLVGVAVGVALTVLVAQGVIPIPFSVCPVSPQ